SPPLMSEDATIKLSDLTFAARHEHVVNLVDLMFRRVGVGWSVGMGYDIAEKAAEAVAKELGWDAKRTAEEVLNYRSYLEHFYRFRPKADVPPVDVTAI